MALLWAIDVTGLPASGAGSVFFARRRDADLGIWKGTGYDAPPVAANIALYRIAAAEQQATGNGLALYSATDPDPTTPGSFFFCTQAGASIAVADLRSFRSVGSCGPAGGGNGNIGNGSVGGPTGSSTAADAAAIELSEAPETSNHGWLSWLGAGILAGSTGTLLWAYGRRRSRGFSVRWLRWH